MKRCAQCHGKLGLGVRSRNLWNGWWWVHVRFCSSRCKALYELEQTTPMHVRGLSSLASRSPQSSEADWQTLSPAPNAGLFSLQVARRATGRPSGEVRHCRAAGRGSPPRCYNLMGLASFCFSASSNESLQQKFRVSSENSIWTVLPLEFCQSSHRSGGAIAICNRSNPCAFNSAWASSFDITAGLFRDSCVTPQ
jgi:hypothetical protein